MGIAVSSSVDMVFNTEADLVESFVDRLHRPTSPWVIKKSTTEWDYRTGVADVLVQTDAGELMVFEAKLENWRKAIYQAYRSTTFAARTYIVLPVKIAERVRVHEQMFARYGVGLCTIAEDGITVLIEASESEPLIPWLSARALSFFCGEDERESYSSRPNKSRRKNM